MLAWKMKFSDYCYEFDNAHNIITEEQEDR